MTQLASQCWMTGDASLRRDMRLLSWLLRQAAELELGADLREQVGDLRELAERHENGDLEADQKISEALRDLSEDRLEQLVRNLGVFFDLANVSEDLQRERVLSDRRESGTLRDGLSERIEHLLHHFDETTARDILHRLDAEFVLTAHPTEARRQTVRRVLERLTERLRTLENAKRPERRQCIAGMREDLRLLLRTDPLHPCRPTVLEELDRALYVLGSLWDAVPELAESFARVDVPIAPLRFGCWIGGDRDGHPHVTCDITKRSMQLLRERCVALHLRAAAELEDLLTPLVLSGEAREALSRVVGDDPQPELAARIARMHPDEYFRHALRSIQQRLESTGSKVSAYGGSSELLEDLSRIESAMIAEGWTDSALGKLRAWKACTRTFGLHGMRLDVRENSRGFRQLIRELLQLLGEDPSQADQDEPGALWSRSFYEPEWSRLHEHFSERSHDLLEVTRLMHESYEETDGEAIGAYIISMTHNAGDVLWVLWLHRLVAAWRGSEVPAIAVAPLFETIDDLRAAPAMLETLFSHPEMAKHLDRLGRDQLVMLGYSDSAKDGGYLAAVWALYEAQDAMQRLAARHKVRLTCFHGRGGALGRGGGPAARAVQSLPPAAGADRIRITEQGEVIADRFIDPVLAHRHLEQVLGGLVEHAIARDWSLPDDWRDCMTRFSTAGLSAYRDLVASSGFVSYFREATPISCIEQLQIGSRPSRRHGQGSLEDLRAIPYTFAWTQSRQLINGFYGLGSGWNVLSEEDRQRCRDMYRDWGFFRALIDNAELALTKSDPVIAHAYAELVEDPAVRERIPKAVAREFSLTRDAILSITGQEKLLEQTPWMRRSVEIRKPYIDVINHVQIELLRRQRAAKTSDAYDRGLRLSVQAIAAGLRTTG